MIKNEIKTAKDKSKNVAKEIKSSLGRFENTEDAISRIKNTILSVSDLYLVEIVKELFAL